MRLDLIIIAVISLIVILWIIISAKRQIKRSGLGVK